MAPIAATVAKLRQALRFFSFLKEVSCQPQAPKPVERVVHGQRFIERWTLGVGSWALSVELGR